MFSNKYNFISFLIVLIAFIQISLACDGYKLKIHKIQNCGDIETSVIKISNNNFTVNLSKNCELSMNGCIETIGFKEAMINYTISKSGMVMLSGDADICAEMSVENKFIVDKLKMIGFPTECPVQANTNCLVPTNKIDFDKQKQYLAMAKGKFEININMKHDSGNSCFIIIFEINK